MLNKTQSQRVFIFDPCFGGLTGHWENYCKRLCQEFSNRHYEVIIFGQNDFQSAMIAQLTFYPVFTTSPFLPAKNMADLESIKKLFLNDFKKIDVEQFSESDIFMFHSIYPTYFNAAIEWTKTIVNKKRILSYFVFQFPPSDTKKHAGIFKNIYYRLRRIISLEPQSVNDLQWSDNNHVRFYQKSIKDLGDLIKNTHVLCANSGGLARNYSLLFGLKVHPIPMPGLILNDINSSSTVFPVSTSDSTSIKIGYFGHGCIDKGAALLEDIIRKILIKDKNIEFYIHANPSDEAKQYFDKLCLIDSPRVHFYHGHIQQALMIQLINLVDIVILPYSHKKYATCPSAVFMEALTFGKLMVIPSETWMAEIAEQYSVDVKKFDYFDADSVIQALDLAITDYTPDSEMMKNASRAFSSNNNIAKYLDCVFEAANDIQHLNH